jgi:hypothetical protein
MARPSHDGTPKAVRSKKVIFPPSQRRLVWWSLAIALAAVVTLIGGYAAGLKRTLSPGDVASHHARIDLKCAQCHDTGNEVASLRCERCHDPSGSERLTHAAHVLLGSGDVRKAESAEETACATCHTDHRGLTASLRAVDDRECATCHTFSTLADHEEFAVVRAQATAGVGLTFSHLRHMEATQEARGTSCQLCHVQTADRAAFEPIQFDKHCASCHAPKGVFDSTSDPISRTLLVTPERLPEPFRSATSVKVADNGEDITATNFKHRDGWVLYNALALGHSLDPDGEAAERLALRSRINYLEQLLRVQPVHQAKPDELQAAAQVLQREIADLDAKLSAEGTSDSGSIAEIQTATQALATELERVLPDDVKADAKAITKSSGSASAGSQPGSDTNAAARFNQRKDELVKLVKTVSGKTTDPALKERADSLLTAINQLNPPAGTGGQNDVGPLLDRLSALDEAFARIRTIPDAGVQGQIAILEVLRGYGLQTVSAGLSAADFESRKAELLALLDAIERKASADMRLRVPALRQRVIAMRPGSTGDAELVKSRRQRQKQLDRIVLEIELLGSGEGYERPPAEDARIDSAGMDRTLQQLRAQLVQLERAPRMSAVSPEDRGARQEELNALVTACSKCHTLDASGARIAPVRIAEPVMPRSIFNHAPHTTQANCDTCHGMVRASKLSTDVNVPSVKSCTTCHSPRQARADCETCHVYHPGSPAKLLAVTR